MKLSKKSILTAIRAWLCLLLALLIVFGVSYYKMLPVIKRYAESVAETVMLDSANEAVIAVLKDEDITYDEIAKLFDTRGK